MGLLQLDSLWARKLVFFLAVSVTDELEEKIWQVRERRDELDVFVLHKYCLLSSDEVGYDPTVEVS